MHVLRFVGEATVWRWLSGTMQNVTNDSMVRLFPVVVLQKQMGLIKKQDYTHRFQRIRQSSQRGPKEKRKMYEDIFLHAN